MCAQGISLSVDQYKEFLKVIPAINEQLRKEGHDVEDVDEPEVPGEREKTKPKKSKESRKANIEATSEEESE